MTTEQVCRVLNEWTSDWLRRHRGVSEKVRTRETVRYHQARNATARKSRVKQRRKRVKALLAL